VVLLASGAGNLAGVLLAPQLRRRLREEVILVGSLLVPGLVALLSARDATKFGITLTAAALAFGSAAGKVAFDSLVQRDGPEELYGRAFARFETRFQLTWVAGALIPVALLDVMDSRMGLFLLRDQARPSRGLSYFGGMRSVRYAPRSRGLFPRATPTTRAARAARAGSARPAELRPPPHTSVAQVRRSRFAASDLSRGLEDRADDRVVEALTMIDRPSQVAHVGRIDREMAVPSSASSSPIGDDTSSARRRAPAIAPSWSSMREST